MLCRPSNRTSGAAVWLVAVVLFCILVINGQEAQAQDTARQGERAEGQESQAPGQGKWNVSTLTIAGSGGAEALRVERMDHPQIRAGQPYEYRIMVRNTSENPVYGVVVRERIPKSMQIEESNPQRSQESAAGENVWRLGRLDPGQTTSICASAIPPDPGAMQTCLTVDYQPTLCTQAMVVQPALKLERQLVDAQGRPRDRILACEDPFLVYRLTNVGSGVTQPAQIYEELHDPFRTAQGAPVIDLNAGRLEAGQPYEQRVPLQVVKPSGEYTGYAVATTDSLRVRSSKGTVAVVKPDLTLTMSVRSGSSSIAPSRTR